MDCCFYNGDVAYDDTDWNKAQSRVAQWLRNRGLSVKHAGYFSPFSLFTPKMTRIGVRWSAYKQIEYDQPQMGWKICFGNNALSRDRQVDFYVFFLDIDPALSQFGIKRPLFLVLRAPLQRRSLAISVQNLLTGKWAKDIDNWRAIQEFDEAKQ